MVVPIVLKRMQILKVPCSYFPTYGLKAISFANSENLYIRFWASEQCIPLYKIYTLYMRCIKTNKFPDDEAADTMRAFNEDNPFAGTTYERRTTCTRDLSWGEIQAEPLIYLVGEMAQEIAGLRKELMREMTSDITKGLPDSYFHERKLCRSAIKIHVEALMREVKDLKFLIGQEWEEVKDQAISEANEGKFNPSCMESEIARNWFDNKLSEDIRRKENLAQTRAKVMARRENEQTFFECTNLRSVNSCIR